ncbi:MAG: hypothetical protein P4M14_00395 [Gammaproteobacteria bacterium]|nr:hypothetical protein [Gammaproteobacteria bacterium]
MKHILKIATLCGALIFSMEAIAETTISFFNSKHHYANLSAEAIKQMVKNHIDVNQYKNVKVQIIYNADHQPDHILVYLFSKKFHHVDITKIAMTNNLHSNKSVVQHYQLNSADLAEQPGIEAKAAACPDPSVEFISFAPNNDSYEVAKAEDVASTAEAHHLKTIRLLRDNATRTNYLNYMSCPNLKGNFYDGDSNPEVIATADGVIYSKDIDQLLRNQFRFKVVNIWLACQAYNDPMKTSVMDTAQSQKYAAGINDLEIGPSDEAAACAMKAAIEGKPITASFQDCYNTFDRPKDGWVDNWGFGGSGSDYFGV